MTAPSFTVEAAGGGDRLVASGDWTGATVGAVDPDLRAYEAKSQGRDLTIDVSGVGRLDTVGAMVLQRVLRACPARAAAAEAADGEDAEGNAGRTAAGFVGADPARAELIAEVGRRLAPCPEPPRPRSAFLYMTNRLGKGVVDAGRAGGDILSFIGITLTTFARSLVQPQRFRWAATVRQMEEAGLNAVPIVGLMSFLIGAVIAFMGARILGMFNAEILTVQLVAISVLREFGVLLTAILIAGRSGSAFTAQIGSMKIREEIDALRVMGLDPMEVLVLPRTIALVIMLPLLALIAALLGLFGGGLVAWSYMEVSPALFMSRMQETVGINNFWVGMIKAPFFAFLIAVVGCHQGMEVGGSAESLGQRTTLSVVQSLFLVILIDAAFAMFFLEIDY